MFFFWLLRQLKIISKEESEEIFYQCKICNQYCKVEISKKEYEELKNGIPFNSVFQKERKESLIHLKKGLCLKHSKSNNE